MNLVEATRRYLDHKRSLGYACTTLERQLKSLALGLKDAPLCDITSRQVLAHLNVHRTSTTVTWRKKYGVLRNFFEHWSVRGEIESSPMPPIRPLIPSTFVPYIYSRLELRALLAGVRHSQERHACLMESRTFRTLLVFLYATGASTGEALRLLREDVDLRTGSVTIRHGKFNRVRRIPIGSDLQNRLRNYIEWKSRKGSAGATLFADKNGNPVSDQLLNKSFKRLRRLTGIRRRDRATYEPRLHDLRHTFAVHRLSAWFKQRADINRLIPALSAYMGQVGLGSTERYLAMTPDRFRKQLGRLSPRSRKKRWRDDPALMTFLSEL